MKFYHFPKWYMHELESLQENETHIILWDFKTQTYHEILVRRLENVLKTKTKTFFSCETSNSRRPQVEQKDSEKINKYLNEVNYWQYIRSFIWGKTETDFESRKVGGRGLAVTKKGNPQEINWIFCYSGLNNAKNHSKTNKTKQDKQKNKKAII